MNRAKRSGVSGVQELQEIEGFAATDFPENDAVGAVAERAPPAALPLLLVRGAQLRAV